MAILLFVNRFAGGGFVFKNLVTYKLHEINKSCSVFIESAVLFSLTGGRNAEAGLCCSLPKLLLSFPQQNKAKKKKKGVVPGGGLKATMKDDLADYGGYDGGYVQDFEDFM